MNVLAAITRVPSGAITHMQNIDQASTSDADLHARGHADLQQRAKHRRAQLPVAHVKLRASGGQKRKADSRRPSRTNTPMFCATAEPTTPRPPNPKCPKIIAQAASALTATPKPAAASTAAGRSIASRNCENAVPTSLKTLPPARSAGKAISSRNSAGSCPAPTKRQRRKRDRGDQQQREQSPEPDPLPQISPAGG